MKQRLLNFIKNNPIRFAVLILSGVVFVLSGVMLLKTQLGYKKGIDTYNDITEQAVSTLNGNASVSGGSASSPSPSDEVQDINTPPISVDFSKLKKINGDIVAWIYCEDTPINYPIVKTDSADDYEVYLKTSVDGQKSVSGSIFLDYRNSPDFLDFNTVIYGHSMKNGTMFAYLLRFDDQEYYENHKYMWLFTESTTYRIDLICGSEVKATAEDYIIYEDVNQFNSYLERSLAKSRFNANTDLSKIGNIVTLSTCAYSDEDSRYVVLGNLVKLEK